MASQGRGHRGGWQNTNQPPPTFDQRAFIEAIGAVTTTISQASAMAATISQASATVSQGGPSNLQRFKELETAAGRCFPTVLYIVHDGFWKGS